MKKILILAIFYVFINLVGCYESTSTLALDDKPIVLEIKEKMFVEQCNDIYLNPSDYKNKIIKIEGIYEEYSGFVENEKYSYVVRYGPGCCGDDGLVGFEIIYDGEVPKVNDWIEVLGTVEVVDEDGYEYIVLKASEVNVLDIRGQEFVIN